MKRWLWLALAAWLPATSVPARSKPAPTTAPARQANHPDAAPPTPAAADLTGELDIAAARVAASQAPEPAAPTAGDSAGQTPPAAKISDTALRAYFESRPPTYLIDPQQLLDPQTARDQSAFLTAHANDSSIDLFLYVFDRDQEIPSDVREEEVIERFFASGRPAMIVYYFWGAPQQAVLYLSPALLEAVTGAEQRRTLRGAVKQALAKASPQDQLQAFSDHLAGRIYWMERLIDDAAAGAPAQTSAQARAAKLAKKPRSFADRWGQWRPLAEALAVPGLLLAGVLAVAVGLVSWLRWHATYRFPEFAVEPRLGGDHAAGVGAVISFASADLPPASQRDQVAECVRRG
jgi:hypothetical protein